MKKLKRCAKEFESDKRMKLQMFILASLALVDCQLGPEYSVGKLTTDRDFICPPRREIMPCQCTTVRDIPTVHCNRIRSFKAMKAALSARFRVKPIPRLKLTEARFVGLPSRAFANVSMTRLHIEDSRLKYITADAFEGMNNLLILRLQNVKLFTLPSEAVNRLSSLVSLSLPNNNLLKIAYGNLRSTMRLKYLSLANNRITQLDRGALPISLITLELSSNHLYALNKTIRNMMNLEWLSLNDNKLFEIENEFDRLYKLTHLKLGRNNLVILGTAFRDMISLKVLELQRNAIKVLGNALRRLNQLETLNLSMNLLLQLRASDFEGLASLKNLYLYGNRLMTTDGALGKLPRLQSLDLSRNNFQNFSFSEIRSLIRLDVLVLNYNQISRISSPASTIPSTQIWLSHNRLTSISALMKHLSFLKEIDVSYNRLNILKLDDFRVSKDFHYINVEGNPLICDAEQMVVYKGLKDMNIDVDGMPNCTSVPRNL